MRPVPSAPCLAYWFDEALAHSRRRPTTSITGAAMTRLLTCLAFATVAALSAARADEPQSLTAQVGDIAFRSGDAEISLVPIGDKFSLSASTEGAAAWPPPKTRIDRLSIVCDDFADGKPLLLDHKAFDRSTCDVRFEKGTRPMGGTPEAEYHLDKNDAANRFEITRANGKVYEGTFSFHLKDDQGGTIGVANGRFKAEDRQR